MDIIKKIENSQILHFKNKYSFYGVSIVILGMVIAFSGLIFLNNIYIYITGLLISFISFIFLIINLQKQTNKIENEVERFSLKDEYSKLKDELMDKALIFYYLDSSLIRESSNILTDGLTTTEEVGKTSSLTDHQIGAQISV